MSCRRRMRCPVAISSRRRASSRISSIARTRASSSLPLIFARVLASERGRYLLPADHLFQVAVSVDEVPSLRVDRTAGRWAPTQTCCSKRRGVAASSAPALRLRDRSRQCVRQRPVFEGFHRVLIGPVHGPRGGVFAQDGARIVQEVLVDGIRPLRAVLPPSGLPCRCPPNPCCPALRLAFACGDRLCR